MTWRNLLHRLSAGKLGRPWRVVASKQLPYPKNAPGDFYVGDGCCISCGIWEIDAPDHFTFDGVQCYVSRQPENEAERKKVAAAMRVSDTECIRYKGRDPTVMAALRRQKCGHLMDE